MGFSICSRSEPAASWLSNTSINRMASGRRFTPATARQDHEHAHYGPLLRNERLLGLASRAVARPAGGTALPPITGTKQLVEVLSPLGEGAVHTAF